MCGSYGSQETGHRISGQVHHGQSAANESEVSNPATTPSALQTNEEDQVRDCLDGHPEIQAQERQAPRPANHQYQAHHFDTNGEQKTIDSGGRQGRGDRLSDYPAMTEAEFATLERVRGGRNRQRVRMEEVDEQLGDRAKPGFLDMLGPRIRSLFRCGGRKQRTTRHTSTGLDPQQVGDEHYGARMSARGIVPAPDSSRNAYHPQLGDTVEHRILRAPAASDARSRAHADRLPSNSIDHGASPISDARAAMSRGETIHISGGSFVDHSVHIYQTDSSNMPTFTLPDSWADSGPTRTMRYEVTVRPIR
ncbi:hypothetical protein BKA70DRAFT_229678 [Coprinopsis sp. MPI-PUGE-AT-0042]|nr:hypothetical protein BKA70DRAFT_229678 [Coprinopsis sp. MPI-PUGE-AT-0042]